MDPPPLLLTDDHVRGEMRTIDSTFGLFRERSALSTAMSSGTMSRANGGDGEDRILEEATNSVKRHAFYMKRSMDEGNTTDVIKHANEMIYELRTGKLSPQNYYDLYISVTDELRHLEAYLEEIHVASGNTSKLYETIQHAGNIIPRLYLLITIGSVYIKTKTTPPMEILFDLVELCKGVQHPTRGLFLRCYLTQCSKDKLPDSGAENCDAKSVKDAIEFVLQNFSEVNRLWVRMQHQGANRDRARRERERQNLRMLVGTNLVRLSQLDSIDLATYKDVVLPRVLEQIITCKDKIAQEYLMDCLIQVFPDEYHLATLEPFLGTCPQLSSDVNTKDVIISLMNRLSSYALQSPTAIPEDIELFAMFREKSKSVIESRESMPLQDTLSLQVALVNFASKVYPERLSYIDDVLGFSSALLQSSSLKLAPPKAVRHVVKLLTVPLETLSIKVLDLSHYSTVLRYLDFDNRKQVSNSIVASVLESGTLLEDSSKLTTLIEYIQPLLIDLDDTPSTLTDSSMKYEFEQEQYDVARMFHLIYNADTDKLYQLYLQMKKSIGSAGPRLPYLVPALCFANLRLVVRVFEREQRDDSTQQIKSKKVFQFIHSLASSISSSSPQMAVRIFLETALAADRCAFEEVTYEFMTQAFVTYEEEIANSKEQLAAVALFAATVQTLSSIGQETFETLSSKVTQHAGRLLKKCDQVRLLCLSANMFWSSRCAVKQQFKGERVLHTLQRALKIGNNVMNIQEQAELLVDIFDSMVVFYEKDVPEISVDRINTVIELVQEHLSELENGKSTRSFKSSFTSIVDRVNTKKNLQTYSTVSEPPCGEI